MQLFALSLAFSGGYFFAFQLPSSSTSERRLHPLIESMLPDARAIRGRYPLISSLDTASLHGRSPFGRRISRLSLKPADVKIKAAISRSAGRPSFTAAACCETVRRFSMALRHHSTTPWRTSDSVRAPASYPPPLQTRELTLEYLL